jgi:hypothetical protein
MYGVGGQGTVPVPAANTYVVQDVTTPKAAAVMCLSYSSNICRFLCNMSVQAGSSVSDSGKENLHCSCYVGKDGSMLSSSCCGPEQDTDMLVAAGLALSKIIVFLQQRL